MESEKEKWLSAMSYTGLWVTGLIIYLVVDKNEKNVRYHAMQAIVFGIAVTAISIILSILQWVFVFSRTLWWFFATIGWIYWILVIIAIVILAIRAYKGEKVKIPMASEIAEKNS